MELTILTPVEELFSGSVSSVKLPGLDGGFQILENHAPLVAALSLGHVEIKDDKGQKQSYSIEKGIVEVLNNKVSLLIEGAQKV